MLLKNTKLLFALLFLSLSATQAQAAGENGSAAKQVVEKFQAELIDVMKNGKKLGYGGRYEKLFSSVSNSHDLTKMARVIVGKEWEKLSIDQQQKLVDSISRWSVAEYAHNFNDFGGESFVFDSEEETPRGGVVVHSRLIVPDDKEVKFDYMLKGNDNAWRIIDIIANGVSNLALRRSEYTSILQNEGFDALIAKINGKIENYSKL
ncbi:MAG: ABC transporter substrate-binding protein [Methylococcales bacterium]